MWCVTFVLLTRRWRFETRPPVALGCCPEPRVFAFTMSLAPPEISSFSHPIPENSHRCTRIWQTAHSLWVASPTAEGKSHFFSQSSCASREFPLMAVSSSRHTPWCTAILDFWRTWYRACIRPRLLSHSATFGCSRLQSIQSSSSRIPQSLRSLAQGNWWPMLCSRRLLALSGKILSCQCFPRRSLLLSSRSRKMEVKFLCRGSCSSATFIEMHCSPKDFVPWPSVLNSRVCPREGGLYVGLGHPISHIDIVSFLVRPSVNVSVDICWCLFVSASVC